MENKNLHVPWILQRGWCERIWILTQWPLRNKKAALFLSHSSLSVSLSFSLSVWGFSPGRMLTSHWPALSLSPNPPSCLSLSLSTSPSFHPFISPSRGAAFRSELMDLRWCMHSHSRIPSSGEKGAVSKKKKRHAGLGDMVGSIRATIEGAEGLERGEGVRELNNWTCPLKSWSE